MTTTKRGRGGARPGAGRKPREGKALRPLLQVRISEERYAAFKDFCAPRSVSEVVDEFVESCLAQKKST